MHSLRSGNQVFRATWARGLTRWSGEVKGPSFAMDFIIGVPDAGSAEKATISFPDGVQNMPLEVLHAEGDKTLRFSLPSFKAKFETSLKEDGTATGIWRMGQGTGGSELPLTMRKLLEEEILKGAARPQHPVPPFPYDVEEVAITSHVDGCTLAGSLTLPRDVAQAPAVLLLTCLGPRDRDQTLFGHKPFLVLADALTQRGCAVLRVDDRGVGASAKGSADSSVDTYAEDALACLKFLRNHARVDTRHVGVLGHDEGAVAAAIAGANANESSPSFIVLLASPGLSGRDTLILQNRAFFAGAGAASTVVELVVDKLNKLMDRVAAGATVDDLLPEAKALLEVQHYATGSKITSISDDAVRASVAQFGIPGVQRSIALDPCQYLARVRCPVLALCGTKDTQTIADAHLPRIEAAVRSAGMPVEVATLQGLNHIFQRAETGMVSEYAEIQETMDPRVLQRIGDFILHSVRS